MHIPFCASVCDFCAFYQEKPQRQDIDRYLAGMAQEFQEYTPLNRPVRTVFWGGGTPGLLPAKDLRTLGELVLQLNNGQKPQEWTVEMAPSTVKPDKIETLLELGVNRISMGVQSFDDDLLKTLGRLHSRRQVEKAYDIIRKGGVQNVNLDLMFAIPGQTEEALFRDLRTAMAMGPEHISTYCLTFEEDTALWVKLSKGQIKRSEQQEEIAYRKTWETLEAGGYRQYEVSNFAKPGFECLHNIDTWRMQEWIGIGPSASSQYAGKRYTNVASIKEWLEGLAAGQRVCRDVVELTPSQLAEDALMFGLRMTEGVDLERWQQWFPDIEYRRVKERLQGWVEQGLLENRSKRYCTTVQGRLLVDRLGLELMG